jgi:ribonuclease HII
MLLVGIDEAGYGPLLGPLVISSVAMSLPDELAGISLWQLLSGGLTDRVGTAKGRIIVADSKKVFRSSTRDVRELERSTLAAVLLLAGTIPENFDHLLQMISLEPEPHLTHRWYCHKPLPLPSRVPLDGLKLSTSLLAREMAGVDAKLISVKSVPLVEKKYNHLAGQTKNKSEVLFSQTVRLIWDIMKESPEKQIRIYVDKQGGKDTYVRNLLRNFSGAQLKVIREGEDESEYLLSYPNQSIQIHFCKKGEQKHLLVAWASMVSKFIRELFMMQFNSYWSTHHPNLHPTAGYWEDGQRFMRDIGPILQKMNISSTELIRQL